MIAAQPLRVQHLRPAHHVVARPVAAGVEERRRERPLPRRLRHPVEGRELRRQRLGREPRHRPALVVRQRVERDRREHEARRAETAREPARAASHSGEMRLQPLDRLGRPARRIGDRDPGVDIVLRRVVVPVPDRHLQPDRGVERQLQEGHHRIPAQLGRDVGADRRVHPVRLPPERARAEEGDRVARILQVDDPHRPPVRAGDVEVVLLVGEADDRAVAEGRQPLGRAGVPLGGDPLPLRRRERRPGPDRAVERIGEHLVQPERLVGAVGAEAQAIEVEPRPVVPAAASSSSRRSRGRPPAPEACAKPGSTKIESGLVR